MDLIEILDSDELALPRSWDNYPRSFEEFAAELFTAYQQMLGQITSNDFMSVEVRNAAGTAAALCDAVTRSIEQYFLGYPPRAYEILAAGLNAAMPHVDAMFTINDISPALTHLYRIRKDATPPVLRQDLFHVPFQERQKVGTYRYSIPGLPCLYLGGSAYVCWKEYKEPQLDSIHITRFRAANGASLQILDFGWRPAYFATLIQNGNYARQLAGQSRLSSLIIAQAICWPIIAACSIRVKHNNGPFKPEYVIPQLVLQWLTFQNNIDGVRYFSTRIDPYCRDPVPMSNFVFPSRTVRPAGYCTTLATKFELCDPVFWATVRGAAPARAQVPHMDFDIEWPVGVTSQYRNTEFGSMQHYLAGLPYGPI